MAKEKLLKNLKALFRFDPLDFGRKRNIKFCVSSVSENVILTRQ